jgi:hypothetical protein
MYFSIFLVLKQLDKDMMVWTRINEQNAFQAVGITLCAAVPLPRNDVAKTHQHWQIRGKHEDIVMRSIVMARITYLQIGGHTEAAKKTRALWRVLDNRREELGYLGWGIVRRRGRWLHKRMRTQRYIGTYFGSLLPP